MSKATLVIMAAGIVSRFGGGIKQLAPFGPNGEIIMDYSIYDAIEAGFDKVVFVIRKDLEQDFKEVSETALKNRSKLHMHIRKLMIFPGNIRRSLRGEQNRGEQDRLFCAVKMWWILHSW